MDNCREVPIYVPRVLITVLFFLNQGQYKNYGEPPPKLWGTPTFQIQKDLKILGYFIFQGV